RSASPTPPAADPAADMFGEVARGVGQRGPGKRSQQFIAKLSAAYGMLPGDLLAETMMHGLREHIHNGGKPGTFLEDRALKLSRSLQCKKTEAFGLLLGVAKELLPYAHQKQPIAVDIEQRAIVFAAVTSDGQAAAPGSGRRDLRPADVRNSP